MTPPNTDERILAYLKAQPSATSKEVADATSTSFKWARRRLKKLAGAGILIEHPSLLRLQETYTIAENSVVPFTSFYSLGGSPKTVGDLVLNTPNQLGFPPPLTEIGVSIHALREQEKTV